MSATRAGGAADCVFSSDAFATAAMPPTTMTANAAHAVICASNGVARDSRQVRPMSACLLRTSTHRRDGHRPESFAEECALGARPHVQPPTRRHPQRTFFRYLFFHGESSTSDAQ